MSADYECRAQTSEEKHILGVNGKLVIVAVEDTDSECFFPGVLF